MRRRISGLGQAQPGTDVGDGVYLVQVVHAQYRWDKQKPYYRVRFAVVEPTMKAGLEIVGRVYTTPRALWKLNWFLRDFGYDTDLLSRDELEEKALVGLRGVVKVTHTTVNGRTYLNLDAFAPADHWNREGWLELGGEAPEVA